MEGSNWASCGWRASTYMIQLSGNQPKNLCPRVKYRFSKHCSKPKQRVCVFWSLLLQRAKNLQLKSMMTTYKQLREIPTTPKPNLCCGNKVWGGITLIITTGLQDLGDLRLVTAMGRDREGTVPAHTAPLLTLGNLCTSDSLCDFPFIRFLAGTLNLLLSITINLSSLLGNAGNMALL